MLLRPPRRSPLRPPAPPPLLPLLLAAVLVVSAAPAAPGEEAPAGSAPVIYKWVDQHGIAHYTTDPERIPASLRNRIRDVGREPPTRDSERWAVRDTPAPAPAPGPALSPADAEQLAVLDQEIAGLEGEIAEDEAALIEMLSREGASDGLSDDPEFRAIAQRLPRLEEELRSLRERRAALERPREARP